MIIIITIIQVDLECIIRVVGVWTGSDDLFSRINANSISSIATHAANMITSLKACVEKRKKQPVVTPEVLARSLVVSPKPLSNNIHSISTPSEKERVVKKSISTGFLSALESVDSMNTPDINGLNSPTTKRYAKLHPFRQAVVFIDNVRDKVREDIRNLLHGLRALFKVHKYIYIKQLFMVIIQL
jgi:hypothetical protein